LLIAVVLAASGCNSAKPPTDAQRSLFKFAFDQILQAPSYEYSFTRQDGLEVVTVNRPDRVQEIISSKPSKSPLPPQVIIVVGNTMWDNSKHMDASPPQYEASPSEWTFTAAAEDWDLKAAESARVTSVRGRTYKFIVTATPPADVDPFIKPAYTYKSGSATLSSNGQLVTLTLETDDGASEPHSYSKIGSAGAVEVPAPGQVVSQSR
jgi:hypothetical protein